MIDADEEEIERIARMVEVGEDGIDMPIDMIRDLDVPAWPTASGETRRRAWSSAEATGVRPPEPKQRLRSGDPGVMRCPKGP